MKKNVKRAFMLAGLMVLITMLTEVAFAEKNEKYEVNGMKFTVGKHEPEKRIIPKVPEVTVITKTIILDKTGKTILSEEENNEELKEGKIVGSIVEQGEGSAFANMIKELFTSIKKLWGKLTVFEKKTDSRLDAIENKLEITSEGSNNVEELTDLTEKILEEVGEQNDRIDELEKEEEQNDEVDELGQNEGFDELGQEEEQNNKIDEFKVGEK